MSIDVVNLLPFGSETAVLRINELGPIKFAQISKRILDRMPISDPVNIFTDDERNSFWSNAQTDRMTELTVLLTANELWKGIVYHQLKLRSLVESLEKAGFSAEMTNAIIKVWSESGLTVCDRLRDMSFSGRSNVRDVSWTLRMNVASHNNPSMHVADAIFQFETDLKSVRIIELGRSKLAELHRTLQEIQENLDILLEHIR